MPCEAGPLGVLDGQPILHALGGHGVTEDRQAAVGLPIAAKAAADVVAGLLEVEAVRLRAGAAADVVLGHSYPAWYEEQCEHREYRWYTSKTVPEHGVPPIPRWPNRPPRSSVGRVSWWRVAWRS